MAKKRSSSDRKNKKLNKILKDMPPKIIYGAWKESGLVDIDPNLLVEEVVPDEISDDELSEDVILELCPESELLFQEFENSEPIEQEQDDREPEEQEDLNQSFVEAFDNTDIQDEPLNELKCSAPEVTGNQSFPKF